MLVKGIIVVVFYFEVFVQWLYCKYLQDKDKFLRYFIKGYWKMC